MKEKGCFPRVAENDRNFVKKVLEFYTQMCNLTVTPDALSVMAATLANGGICPLTGDRCVSNNSGNGENLVNQL